MTMREIARVYMSDSCKTTAVTTPNKVGTYFSGASKDLNWRV
jgi:hypothetical protein